MDVEAWDEAWNTLRLLIGDVTVTLAEIEEACDALVLDLLFQAPSYSFVKRHVLGRMMLSGKVDLLLAYANEFEQIVADADTARVHLEAIKAAATERNRMVHDLHDVSSDDGQVTRRRLWEEDGRRVDLVAYRELADRLDILAGPGMEAVAEALLVSEA